MHSVPKTGKVLDLGCGPTLFPAAVASLYVENIDVADYSLLNRNEVTKWLNKDVTALDYSVPHEYIASLKRLLKLLVATDCFKLLLNMLTINS